MNKSIVLVFVLNFLGKHSHCDQAFGDTEDTLKEVVKPPANDICYCVRINQCNKEDISKGMQCINDVFNAVEPNNVCCRSPPRRSTMLSKPHPNLSDPTKKPSQRPQPPTQSPPKTSTNIPAMIPLSTPTTQAPSLTLTQIPITDPPTQIRPSSSQSQPQDTSQASPPKNTACTCMPLRECHNETDKNNGHHKQGSCPNPGDYCCRGLVQPVTAPHPQAPKPSSTSPSTDKNCICTPFYKSYDEETSSDLTGVVNDRRFIPNTEESCLDLNDICCYNLVKITAKPIIDSSSEDCTGSCKSIKECPHLLNKLTEAQEGNWEAIQELRSSVCSKTNGILHVCCPPEAKGVIWPER